MKSRFFPSLCFLSFCKIIVFSGLDIGVRLSKKKGEERVRVRESGGGSGRNRFSTTLSRTQTKLSFAPLCASLRRAANWFCALRRGSHLFCLPQQPDRELRSTRHSAERERRKSKTPIETSTAVDRLRLLPWATATEEVAPPRATPASASMTITRYVTASRCCWLQRRLFRKQTGEKADSTSSTLPAMHLLVCFFLSPPFALHESPAQLSL